ncbi:MAG: tRNA pseudouridine(55) synthase TruB [Pseudomonadota bacterium]|nr:tRNA pseudouridine(55) synthase TruB [Pseudomonadota bacterium]
MARRKKGRLVSGWLILDKPGGLTSTEVVTHVRRLFDARKAGHAGTLDPLATGILPIALGEATKTVPFVMDGRKTYRFTVCWGVSTDSHDAEGIITAERPQRPARADIEGILHCFQGDIRQVPPRFSAIRVSGQRAYDLARAEEDFELQERAVRVDRLEIIEIPDENHCVFEMDCGKGTYVRSLARDMGEALGCFGYVYTLRRTRVGPFTEKSMISLDMLEDMSHSAAGCEGLDTALRPVETALDDIPALAISGEDAARLMQGQAVLLRGRDAPILKGPVYATSGGELVALGEVRRGELWPTRVFRAGS